jgi:hypothetical protein
VTRTQRNILISILCVEAIVRVAIVASVGPMTDNGLYGDDSYMSHQFARNMAEGRGITQAGVPNNGFQPLFVFLLVPFYWFLDVYQATVASALLTSACSVMGSFLLFRVIRRVANVRAALIGAGMWAVSAHLTRVGLNGLETALANMFMLLTIDLHLASAARRDDFSARRGALLGCVMGLAMLARIDLGLLLLPLGIDQIRLRVRHRQCAPLAIVMIVGAVTIAPWFLWSKAACGSWTPVSGAATRTIAQLYGSPTGPARDPVYFPLGEVPWRYYESNLAKAGRELACLAPIALLVRPWYGESTLVCAGWLALLAMLAWLSLRWKLPEDVAKFGSMFVLLWPVWIFPVLLIGVYCCYFFAQWHYWRYFTPVTIVLMIPFAMIVERLLVLVYPRFGKGPVVAVLLLTVAVGLYEHRTLFQSADPTGIAARLYLDAMDLDKQFPADVRLASFESGTLDYFMQRDIINLDGKTNINAHQAMVDGNMHQLIEDLQVDYVVSSPPLVRDLMLQRGRWRPGQVQNVARLRHNWVFRIEADPVPRPIGTDGARY